MICLFCLSDCDVDLKSFSLKLRNVHFHLRSSRFVEKFIAVVHEFFHIGVTPRSRLTPEIFAYLWGMVVKNLDQNNFHQGLGLINISTNMKRRPANGL